jgi:YfiH family protein
MTLPQLDPAFHWHDEVWGVSLRCRPLEQVAQHLFTTRQLRLRSASNGPPAQVAALDPWEQAAAALGATAADLLRIRQVHGSAVHVVRNGDRREARGEGRPEADAVASDVPGAVLAVQVADCVPLLMADARSGVAAAVHAGWRGTAAGVARAAVSVLCGDLGARAGDLIVALGPSIGACCYEVGPELRDAFLRAGATRAQIDAWFLEEPAGCWRLDLWRANRDQLIEAGVAPDRIHVCGLCTKTYAHLFDSYRAEGPRAGRMAALVRVPALHAR